MTLRSCAQSNKRSGIETKPRLPKKHDVNRIVVRATQSPRDMPSYRLKSSSCLVLGYRNKVSVMLRDCFPFNWRFCLKTHIKGGNKNVHLIRWLMMHTNSAQ